MKILLALDDSIFSEAALSSVGQRPWPQNTEFQLITIVEFGRHELEGSEVEDVHNLKPLEEKLVESVKEALAAKVKTLRQLLPECQVSSKVLSGRVKDAILHEAEAWGADFIVVGSHGRKGIQRFLLGSVAESILAHAPCAVEIVKIRDALIHSLPGSKK
jgi:nucleotide-binding universal stress UspA family protein